MRPVRRAARRRLRKVLALRQAGVSIDEISYKMNTRPKTVRKMLRSAGIHVPETANNEKGAA